MEQVLELITQDWQELLAAAPRYMAAVVVLLVFYFAGKYFSKLVTSLLKRSGLRTIHEAFFKTLITILFLFIGLIIALNILGLEKIAVSLLAGGGVTAVVLGFAFREIGENLLAGIFLAFSRPFKAGDTIRSEDIEGVVKDIELRYTHLRSDDGRDIYVPSSQLFSKPVTNFTRDGLRRIDFSVGIDYSNDTKSACKLLKETIVKVQGVLQTPEAGAFILALSEQYVELKAFFWVDVFDKSNSVSTIRTDVLDACRRALLDNGYIVSSETTSNIAITSTPDK